MDYLPSLKTVTTEDPLAEEWYFCLDHRRVEPAEGCRDGVRVGPFPSRREAEHALDKIEKRNQEWETDPAWSEDDEQ